MLSNIIDWQYLSVYPVNVAENIFDAQRFKTVVHSGGEQCRDYVYTLLLSKGLVFSTFKVMTETEYMGNFLQYTKYTYDSDSPCCVVLSGQRSKITQQTTRKVLNSKGIKNCLVLLNEMVPNPNIDMLPGIYKWDGKNLISIETLYTHKELEDAMWENF